MKRYELGIKPIYLDAVLDGTKTFEVIKKVCNFKIGDIIVLKEYENGKYLERQAEVEIIYILDGFDGIKEGYVVLGIKKYKSISIYALEKENNILREVINDQKEVIKGQNDIISNQNDIIKRQDELLYRIRKNRNYVTEAGFLNRIKNILRIKRKKR